MRLRYQAREQQCVALPWYEEGREQERTEDKKTTGRKKNCNRWLLQGKANADAVVAVAIAVAVAVVVLAGLGWAQCVLYEDVGVGVSVGVDVGIVMQLDIQRLGWVRPILRGGCQSSASPVSCQQSIDDARQCTQVAEGGSEEGNVDGVDWVPRSNKPSQVQAVCLMMWWVIGDRIGWAVYSFRQLITSVVLF